MEVGSRENCHDLRHGSGEIGCRGYLLQTWQEYAREIIGYVPERTEANERYVTIKKIQRWLDQGKDPETIFLIWNQGREGACRAGINSHGVRYNSCAYVRGAIRMLEK